MITDLKSTINKLIYFIKLNITSNFHYHLWIDKLAAGC